MTTLQTEKIPIDQKTASKTCSRCWLALVALFVLGLFTLACTWQMSAVSGQFGTKVPISERPVLPVVYMLMVFGVGYLLSCWLQTKIAVRHRTVAFWWIIGVGLLGRIVLLPSTPIMEIDLYRYLWDGHVLNASEDPFEYAPIEFVQWQYPEESRHPFVRTPERQEWIESFAVSRDPAMREVLGVMATHFGQYTTPYPPVSQVVFAASDLCCAEGTELKTRIAVLKTFLVLFEFATGIVLVLILRAVGMSTTWSIVWFWSPMAMKEFANGGHLDSIAIFFCTLFVLFCIKQIANREKGYRYSFAAGVCLALGIGAKVFPFVLAPLWAVVTLRHFGLKAILPGALSLLVVIGAMYPMLEKVVEHKRFDDTGKPVPGILAFAESWEMNDLIFMLVVENLKPNTVDAQGNSTAPWFVAAPGWLRDGNSFQSAFGRTRLITTIAFGCIVVLLIVLWWLKPPDEQAIAFARVVFLTLAWFWFLSPTQNPWYWCWALPFVALARQRSWLLVGVLALLYYARFYYSFSAVEDSSISVSDFDFYFPFYEFATVLCLLLVESVWLQLKPALIDKPAQVSSS